MTLTLLASDPAPASARTAPPAPHAVFNAQMSQCLCSPQCSVPGMLELANSFALLSGTDRSNALRAILLAVTAPTGESNDLLYGDK